MPFASFATNSARVSVLQLELNTVLINAAVDIRELKLLSELNHPNIVRLVSLHAAVRKRMLTHMCL